MIDAGTFDEILLDVMMGMSTAKACVQHKVPRKKFYAQLRDDSESATRFTEAKNIGLEAWADEIIDLADAPIVATKTTVRKGPDGEVTETVTGDNVDRTKLRIDARKWILARLMPYKYGDRTTLSGDPTAPFIFTLTETLAKL